MNIFRIWSHSPGTIRETVALAIACKTATSLPETFREILTLFCAKKLQCDYIWTRHVPGALKTGVKGEHVDALDQMDLTGAIWSDKEKAFLAFVQAVFDAPNVDDLAFKNMQKYFSEREIVEILTMQVCSSTKPGNGDCIGVNSIF
jgi:alkylhydroperoxidase family enzyme